jgi:enoyl-CoA hydratase/carnithine racemase
MSSAEPIYLAKDGSLATLWLNRPDKMNAMTEAMWRALPDLCSAVAGDPAVKLLLVRGAGGAAFSAGADISEFGEVYGEAERARAYNDLIREGQAALERLARPTIAVIDGVCVGGGCGIALHCDLRLASEAARFGITPAKLGIAYSFGDTKRLVDTVGPAVARDMLFTGRLLDAAEAERVGLIHRAVPAKRLASLVDSYVETLLSNSQYSIRAAKAIIQAICDGADGDTAETRRWFDDSFVGEDLAEGRAAFVAKRAPQFPWR